MERLITERVDPDKVIGLNLRRIVGLGGVTASPFASLLTTTFHDGRFQNIELAPIITKTLGKLEGSKAVIIGGEAAFGLAGFSYWWTGTKRPDHFGNPVNDFDLTIVAEDTRKRFVDLVNSSVMDAAARDRRIEFKWFDSLWGTPAYLQVYYQYYRSNMHAMDIHYIRDESADLLENFIGKYIPWYSTHLGHPFGAGKIGETKEPELFTCQPFDVDSKSGQQIKIARPERILSTPRIMVLAPRIAYAQVFAQVISGSQAEVDKGDVARIKEAVVGFRELLTTNRRSSLLRRIQTTLAKAGNIQKFVDNPYASEDSDRHDLFKKLGLPDAATQVMDLLIRMGVFEVL